VTILLVEQNASLALQSADRDYVLNAGQIIIAGAATDLLADERVRKGYLEFINEYLPARAAAGLKPSARGTKATFVAWGNNTFMIP